MADWWWALAIPPTGSARTPVTAGGPFYTLTSARGRKLTLRCDPDQDDDAVFTLNGRSDEAAQIAELATDLVVIRDGDVLFRGRIAPATDTLDPGRHDAQFGAWSYRTILRRRNLMNASTLSWTTTDQAVIAWNLITYTQGQPAGNLGLTQGAGAATGVTRTVSYLKGDFIGDKISELAKLDQGFDWNVTPYGITDLRLDIWYPRLAVNRGVVIEHGADLAQQISRTVDPSAYENAAYITGDSSVTLTPAIAFAAGIATAPEGRWEADIGTAYRTQEGLDKHALWVQGTGQILTPSYQVTLRRGAWKGPDHIWPGDMVRLRIASGRLNVDADYRVVQMDLEPGESGDEQVTVALGSVPPRPLHYRVASMLTRLSLLERK